MKLELPFKGSVWDFVNIMRDLQEEIVEESGTIFIEKTAYQWRSYKGEPVFLVTFADPLDNDLGKRGTIKVARGPEGGETSAWLTVDAPNEYWDELEIYWNRVRYELRKRGFIDAEEPAGLAQVTRLVPVSLDSTAGPYEPGTIYRLPEDEARLLIQADGLIGTQKVLRNASGGKGSSDQERAMKEHDTIKVYDIIRFDDLVREISLKHGANLFSWQLTVGLRYAIEVHRLGSRVYIHLTAHRQGDGSFDVVPESESHRANDLEAVADEFVSELRAAVQGGHNKLPQMPGEHASREDWYLYKLRCDMHPTARFTHKQLGEKLHLTEGTVRNYFNTWKAGIDVENI